MNDLPLVSAIMPTANRSAFAAEAVERFHTQTWPNKELVILDERERPSFRKPRFPADVQYHVSPHMTIGARRNLACSLARGAIICHWDDDDISSPDRMAHQVGLLVRHRATLTGYHPLLFIDEDNQCWQYKKVSSLKTYALGTSLMYTREIWAERPFQPVPVGEDGVFIRNRQILVVDGEKYLIARIHSGNTSKKKIKAPLWTKVFMGGTDATVGNYQNG
jgi:hypothetical protein